MPKPNQITISKSLHGFINYQIVDGVLADLSLASLNPTNMAACGLFSVHHAMVFLGQGDSIQNMKRLHPSFWDLFHAGLCSDKMASIIRNAGAKSDVIENWSLRQIKSWTNRHLSVGHPVIIGSEPACHWICLGGKTSDGDYVWADSAAHPALGTITWDELAEWMGGDDELEYPFEAVAVLPGRRMPASRSIVPWIEGAWEVLACDSKHAREWSNLLADMLQVFWDAEYVRRGIAAGDFLDQHGPSIVDAVSSLNGWNKLAIQDHANAYRDTAHFHNLVVDPGQESITIARFSLMLQARSAQSNRYI